jgi:hypothetical protein
MIKNFLHFSEISVFGIDHLRDPATVITNIILFIVSFWSYRKILKEFSPAAEPVKSEARNWAFFFLFGSFAYLIGVPVHGFSWYFSELNHFYTWLVMGWMQILAVAFAQFATAKRYFPENLKWIRPLIMLQFIFFCTLMVFIRKFAAVNIDAALGLVPIAIWHISLYRKNKLATPMVGWGILFSALGGVAFILKIMISPWFSYNDLAHVFLTVSLLLIYSGLKKNFSIH